MMTKFFHFIAIVVLSLTLFSASPVSAQSLTLHDAQARGLVGERIDGYVGIVKDAPGVRQLVDEINLQRRQLYRDIARKNSIPIDTVERLAADKAIGNAGSGEYVQDAAGNWVKKP